MSEGCLNSDDSAVPIKARPCQGTSVNIAPDRPGAASAMKLIRSVFMKGITGLLFESLEAAERYGLRAALEEDIARWINERPMNADKRR